METFATIFVLATLGYVIYRFWNRDPRKRGESSGAKSSGTRARYPKEHDE